MTEYKLMPKQITKEMAEAFWEEYSKSRTDDLLIRCYKAMYTVAPSHNPHPAEQQTALDISAMVEALERISNMDSMSYHSLESAKIVARKTLATYRKQGGKEWNEFRWRDIGDGNPVMVRVCPKCGVAPSNVDDCGEFGNPGCPYFGIGEEERDLCNWGPLTYFSD